MKWLLSQGLVVFQLAMLLALLAMVWVLMRWAKASRELQIELAADRVKSIELVSAKAEALSAETAKITETLHQEQIATAKALTVKLQELFNVVGQGQADIKNAVDKTGRILSKELLRPEKTETTREQIDAIQETTEAIKNRVQP